MSLDERLRQGLEGLDAIEDSPSDSVVEVVVDRGRRSRWGRRLAATAIALAALLVAFFVAPHAIEALRGAGGRRPAAPGGGRGVITTIAGTGIATSSGDGGPAIGATLEYPVDLDFDGQGNLYVLELGEPSNPPRVRKIDTNGRITTVAGPGAPGEAGQLILGTTYGATGLAVDADGDVYIGGGDGPDIENKIIRVDPSGGVTTVAGTGEPGSSGDGGPATDAEVQSTWDVAVDRDGNVYVAGNNRIRKVDTEGIITTIVGGGKKGFSGDGGPAVDAQIERVTGVSVDDFGNVYFIDYGNARVRMIDSDGIINTIVGNGQGGFSGDGGPANEASMNGAEHLWADDAGNVFIADTYNRRIREVDARGVITTAAGTGERGFTGDGGQATLARLSLCSGVAIGPDGNLYIADSANDRVRKVIL